MGLFDKFRKKVREAASEVDSESLSAEEGTDEANQAISQHQKFSDDKNPPEHPQESIIESDDDDWEDFDEEEKLELPSNHDDEWDDWEDDEEYTLPTKLSRKEKKILARKPRKTLQGKKLKKKR